MKKLAFILMIIQIHLMSIAVYSNDNQPITTTLKWEGLDTLSKYYRSEKFKKSQNPFEKGGKNESKIPFKKDGNNNILGEPISDPRVIFSTYVGGNGYDCGNSIAFDSQENIFIVGYSGSTNMATTEGCFQKDKKGGHDAFIGKFTNKGKLIWMTYLGGMNTDVATDCIVDDSDNLIVVGKTDSPDFPFTEGTYHGSSDVFITKFSSDGKMLWSKCFGDTAFEAPQGIAKAENGNFVICGYTSSPGLPMKGQTAQKINAGNNDAFIAKFDIEGNLIWSSYWGGGANDIGTGIAYDKSSGEVALCGYTVAAPSKKSYPFPVSDDAFQRDTSGAEDAFVALFDSTGRIKLSTLYGGKYLDKATGITIDNERNITFTGYTGSQDFPITDNAYQKKLSYPGNIFVTKFNNTGKQIFSTFYGGNKGEAAYSIDCDTDNNYWITGYTMSTDFPTTDYAIFRTIYGNQLPDIFFGRFKTDGYPSWVSCYQSASGIDFCNKIRTIIRNKFIITGETDGNFFPVTNDCFQKTESGYTEDAFLVMIDLLPTDIREEVDFSDNISVFKNLHDNTLIIKTLSNENITEISFFNLLGNILFNINNVNDTKYRIQLNPYDYHYSGLYLMKITTNKRTIIKKFIY